MRGVHRSWQPQTIFCSIRVPPSAKKSVAKPRFRLGRNLLADGSENGSLEQKLPSRSRLWYNEKGDQEIVVKKPDTKQLLAGSRTVGLLSNPCHSLLVVIIGRLRVLLIRNLRLFIPLLVFILGGFVLRLFLPLLVVILFPVGVLIIIVIGLCLRLLVVIVGGLVIPLLVVILREIVLRLFLPLLVVILGGLVLPLLVVILREIV